jgi:hypothetical protein
LADGSVCLAEVGGEEDVEKGAGDTLNCVGDGEDCNTLGLRWVLALKGDENARTTHVFDVGAGVDGNDVAVLDTEVVADNTVDAGLTILEIVVGENDQDGVLALLSLDQDSIATEELESLHGVVREGDDGVVIVGGVSDTEIDVSTLVARRSDGSAYMSELGFFFFLRIAVDTSFSTWEASQL